MKINKFCVKNTAMFQITGKNITHITSRLTIAR